MEWDGRPIREIEELDRSLWETPPGTEVEVRYERYKKGVSILSRHPWESGRAALAIGREHPLRVRWGIDVFGAPGVRPPGDAPGGVWIHAVAAESPAGRAGLRPGDVIRSWNGEVVRDLQALRRAFLEGGRAEPQALLVQRRPGPGAEWRDVRAVLRPRPAK